MMTLLNIGVVSITAAITYRVDDMLMSRLRTVITTMASTRMSHRVNE